MKGMTLTSPDTEVVNLSFMTNHGSIVTPRSKQVLNVNKEHRVQEMWEH